MPGEVSVGQRICIGLAGISRPVWAILAVALILRLAVVGATWDYRPATDAADFHRHAVSIVEGEGYPDSDIAAGGGETAFRPPAYPVFLASVYEVTGPKVNAARLVQSLLGVLTVALIGLIALRLWGRRVALIALGLAAIYPALAISDSALISEPLFLPLELGALAAVVENRRSPHRYRWLLLAGALAGLLTLTRSNGVVLLLPLALAVWQAPRLSRRALAAPAMLVALALLVVAPWTIRNAVAMDSFVPVSTQAGYAAAGTYNETSRDDPTYPAAWRPPNLVNDFDDVFASGSRLDEVEASAELRQRAADYLSNHPDYLLEVGYWNTVRLFDLTGTGFGKFAAGFVGLDPSLAEVGILSFYPTAVLALIGAFTTAARRSPLYVWLFPVLIVISVVLISGSSRYRTPVEPFLVLLAALAVDAGWRRWRPIRTP